MKGKFYLVSIMKKNCQYCNKEFTTNQDRKVYCDYTCSKKSQSVKANEKKKKPIPAYKTMEEIKAEMEALGLKPIPIYEDHSRKKLLAYTTMEEFCRLNNITPNIIYEPEPLFPISLKQYSNQQIIDEFMRRFFLCGDFYTKEDIITLYNLNNDFDFNDFKASCQDNKGMLENAYDVMNTLITDYNNSLDN